MQNIPENGSYLGFFIIFVILETLSWLQSYQVLEICLIWIKEVDSQGKEFSIWVSRFLRWFFFCNWFEKFSFNFFNLKSFSLRLPSLTQTRFMQQFIVSFFTIWPRSQNTRIDTIFSHKNLKIQLYSVFYYRFSTISVICLRKKGLKKIADCPLAWQGTSVSFLWLSGAC